MESAEQSLCQRCKSGIPGSGQAPMENGGNLNRSLLNRNLMNEVERGQPLMNADRTLIVANAICNSVVISVLSASISGSNRKGTNPLERFVDDQ